MSACRLVALRCWAGSPRRRRRQCCSQEVSWGLACPATTLLSAPAVSIWCSEQHPRRQSCSVYHVLAVPSMCCSSWAYHSFCSCAAAQELGCPLVLAPDDVQFSAAASTVASSSASSGSPVPALLWQQARMALSGQTAAALAGPGEPAELGKPHGFWESVVLYGSCTPWHMRLHCRPNHAGAQGSPLELLQRCPYLLLTFLTAPFPRSLSHRCPAAPAGRPSAGQCSSSGCSSCLPAAARAGPHRPAGGGSGTGGGHPAWPLPAVPA